MELEKTTLIDDLPKISENNNQSLPIQSSSFSEKNLSNNISFNMNINIR